MSHRIQKILLGEPIRLPETRRSPPPSALPSLVAHLLAFILCCPVYQLILGDPLLRGQQPRELDPGVRLGLSLEVRGLCRHCNIPPQALSASPHPNSRGAQGERVPLSHWPCIPSDHISMEHGTFPLPASQPVTVPAHPTSVVGCPASGYPNLPPCCVLTWMVGLGGPSPTAVKASTRRL